MKTNALGFIGGGRITKIFLQAFANMKVDFSSVIVFDTNADTLAALQKQFPFIKAGSLEEAASQQTVFIALHPPMIMETLDKIAGIVAEEALVVSLAPKITLEKMASKLNTKAIARMIPNATSYINEGFNPITYGNEMAEADKLQVNLLLKTLGQTFETDQAKLEAYAVTSAMLPTYFWFQIQELEKIAQQTGLTSEEASLSVKTTLQKAINLYFDSGLTPAEVIDLIPVKPIGEHQEQIIEIYQTQLMGLFQKIKP